MFSEVLTNALCVCGGTVASCILGCLPALHIYNVAGFVILGWTALAAWTGLSSFQIALFMMGLIVGYSFINTIPSIFWGAPDESCAFLVLPSSKFLMQGRGYEATLLTGVGSLTGAAMLLLATPAIFHILPTLNKLIAPHMGWILMTIIAYMLMSEFPKTFDRAEGRFGRFLDAYRSVGAGILTFVLSAILGIIVTSRNLVPLNVAMQGIMPAFVGLFAVPWVLGNIISRTTVPHQHVQESLDVSGSLIVRGTFAGSLGGFFAAIFPIVTAGIGALISGHATAQQDDRLFIMSYGVNKVIYYVGAFLFFFAPGLGLTRGGMAIMVGPHFQPSGYSDYVAAMGAIALSAGLSFLLMVFAAQLSCKVIKIIDYRYLSWGALILICSLVYGLTGPLGFFTMMVASCIGWIPVLFNSRRSNCMGILLFPVSMYMSGYGPYIWHLMGLD